MKAEGSQVENQEQSAHSAGDCHPAYIHIFCHSLPVALSSQSINRSIDRSISRSTMSLLPSSSRKKTNNNNKAHNAGITGPKSTTRPLRSFRAHEQDVLSNWSLLPRLFDDWDMDKSGTIDRDELLYGIKRFCRSNEIVYSPQIGRQLMDAVDINNDQEFDQQEFVAFLTLFSQSTNVAIFDVVYFMQDLLEARDEWKMDGKQSLLVVPKDKDNNNDSSSVFSGFWSSMTSSLGDEAL